MQAFIKMVGSEISYFSNGSILGGGVVVPEKFPLIALENIELVDVRLIDLFTALKQCPQIQPFFDDSYLKNVLGYMEHIDLKEAQISFEKAQKNTNRNAFSHLEIQRIMGFDESKNEILFENQFKLNAVSKPLVIATQDFKIGEIATSSVFGEIFERVAFLPIKFNPKIRTFHLNSVRGKKHNFIRDEINLMEIFKAVSSETFAMIQGSPDVPIEKQKIVYESNDFRY